MAPGGPPVADLIEAAPCGLLVLDAEGRIQYLNRTLADWLERPAASLIGHPPGLDLFNKASWLYVQTHVLPLLSLQGGFQEIALSLRSASGGERPTLVAGRRIEADGSAILIFGPAEDRARLQHELAQIRETAQTRLTWLDQIERIARIGAWAVDLQTQELTWSPQVFAIHDLPLGPAPTLDRALSYFPEGLPRQTVEAALKGTIDTGEPFQIETTLRTALGDKIVRSRGGASWEKGRIRRIIGIFEDITREAIAQQDLWRAAHIDELSGLTNRAWFRQRLADQLQAAGEGALVLLDLDRFKEVNDAHGHAAGDAVIRAVGERLAASLGPDALVGRHGGDEFAVLLPGPQTPEALEAQVERLAARLRQTISVGRAEIHPGVSIGIARFPQDGATPEDLLRCADTALLHAKQTRKGATAYFDWHIRAEADRRRLAIDRVRQALASGRVVAHYQPVVELASGRITGYEALARLCEADGRVSGPGDWGPALDDPECARGLDRAVLRHVIDAWPRLRGQAGPSLRIGLNTSAYSLTPGTFVPHLLASLQRAALPPSALEVEVLETVVVGDPNSRLSEQLSALRRSGISVALDDFGTGFASLRHLIDLPIDRIKLDRSFLLGPEGALRGRSIVRATVGLAHALGLKVVAEGIETPGARDFLGAIGCDEGQGFLFGRHAAAEAQADR